MTSCQEGHYRLDGSVVKQVEDHLSQTAGKDGRSQHGLLCGETQKVPSSWLQAGRAATG